ncbi:MAG: putative peptidoglycan glycosyltransferase FtsW [Pseudomonadota bacterium]
MTAPARSDRSAFAVWRRRTDWPIVVAAFGLIAFGLVLSLAAGPPAAARLGYPDYVFVQKHAVFAAAAVVVLLAASALNEDWVRRVSALIFAGGFMVMALILVLGTEVNGSQRWIRLFGVNLQPSEAVKPALIILVGWLLAQREAFPGGPWAPVAFALYGSTLGLLLLQPDVGQSALLTATFVLTFFVSGLPIAWAASFAGGGAALAGILYATLPHVRQRVNSFVSPAAYDTHQIDVAQEAIARGGLLGVGPGEGAVKRALPEAHTDFVYAVASEEFGLVGAGGLILGFTFITLRGLQKAARLADPYPRAAAAGLFALFGLQATINIGVNLSLLPPKGMTLPLVSYGGSSMVAIALTLGLGLALIRNARPHIRIRSAYA